MKGYSNIVIMDYDEHTEKRGFFYHGEKYDYVVWKENKKTLDLFQLPSGSISADEATHKKRFNKEMFWEDVNEHKKKYWKWCFGGCLDEIKSN